MHQDNTFLTLTYDNGSLPILSSGLATLMPEHLRDFLKRLRKKHSPNRLRFFACGEYGEENERPHYHAALFSFPNCERGQTGLGRVNPRWDNCCSICRLVGETWGKGNIFLGTLEADSAQYVAGYVTKKMTHRQNPWLKGRDPEFARMSNRPGIAADFMWDSASAFMEFNLGHTQSDVPVTLRHGSKQLPLGRYLRMKYREYIGRDKKTPEQVLTALDEEVRAVREAAFNNSQSFASALADQQKQALANLVGKHKLRNRKKTL